jgi:L-methionine (R)-S-oxide reductase
LAFTKTIASRKSVLCKPELLPPFSSVQNNPVRLRDTPLETTMHLITTTAGLTKTAAYRELNHQFSALLTGERDGLANSANLTALLFQALPQINWVGFYFLRGDDLVLGPFQGKVACVRIPIGRGVCGTSAQRRETVIVPDVHAFPGHIACDSASRSEIVVPLLHQGQLLGVLDLDSPEPARFDSDDATGLTLLVTQLLQKSDWNWLHS